MGCDASGNGANGIRVVNRRLVTLDVGSENFEDGIVTGGFCTVIRKTASDNDDDGIYVGHDGSRREPQPGHPQPRRRQLRQRVHVKCPSTVAKNVASGNDANCNLRARAASPSRTTSE